MQRAHVEGLFPVRATEPGFDPPDLVPYCQRGSKGLTRAEKEFSQAKNGFLYGTKSAGALFAQCKKPPLGRGVRKSGPLELGMRKSGPNFVLCKMSDPDFFRTFCELFFQLFFQASYMVYVKADMHVNVTRVRCMA